ncbi:MAG: hypothetical protein IKA36_03865 [Clostridia bacterium]|nr:hypothetical protein [Clostridia bacterium]
MSKKIQIELIVPDDAGNDAVDILHVARETFHENFKGNKDYVESRIVVWDNRDGGEEFDTTGVIVDFDACENKYLAATKLFDAFKELVTTPEYIGMLEAGTLDDAETDDKEDSECVCKFIQEFIVPTDMGLMRSIDKVVDTISNDGTPSDEFMSEFTDEDINNKECILKVTCDLTDKDKAPTMATHSILELTEILSLPGMPLYQGSNE